MVLYCSHNYFHEFWLDPQHRWLKYSPSLETPLCFGDACRCSLSYLSPDLLCKYLWWLEWKMSNLDPSLRKTQIFSPGFMSFGHTQKWQHSCVDFVFCFPSLRMTSWQPISPIPICLQRTATTHPALFLRKNTYKKKTRKSNCLEKRNEGWIKTSAQSVQNISEKFF